MIGVAADVSIDEAKLIIRRLQLDAYYCLVNAFRASGYLTKTKLRILQDLSLYFQLSSERHQAEVRRAVNDEELTALADLVTKDDSSYEWICEGRHPVPVNLDDTSYKLPRYVKLRKESVKTEKIKEKKPCSIVPVVNNPVNLTKGTQTPTIKKEPGEKETVKVEPKEEKSIASLLNNTPDILDAAEVERIVEDSGDSLLMYIPLDKKPNTEQEIPELPELPSVVPVRVGEEFGKMLLEQIRTVRDQTGHVQIPLDLARITKERLEKKIKQRQRRPNNLALSDGSGVPGVKGRRKKRALPPTASPSMHGMLEHSELGPTLTTPEPPADHLLNKDILVKVGPPPGPPLLTKAPPYDLQSPSYHGLQPPMLQRMPGVPVSSIAGVQSPIKSSYPPSTLISPSKSSYSQGAKSSSSPHTPGLLRFRSSEDEASRSGTDQLTTPEMLTQEQRHAQKQWASRSEAAWQELSRSEPNSIQVQRHFSQQKEGTDPLGKRKYSGGQEIHLLTREQWISDHIQSHVAGAAKETGQLTPDRVLQESVKESQRMKLAELESERSRSEESDRRKEEERMRIEERLKMDEKLRQEENRAQQQHMMKLEVHHKTGKVDHKPGKEAAGDGGKSFGKHDPTTSYLSTYMPKTNASKGPGRQSSVSKLSRTKGKPISGDVQQSGDQYKQDTSTSRVEVSKNVRIESIPQGVPHSISSSRSEHCSEKKEERVSVKPTIQILTQTPKLAQEYKQGDYAHHSREVIHHSRDSGQTSRTVTSQPRDVTSHARDVTHHSRTVTSHSRDVTHHSRDSSSSRDVSSQQRDTSLHARESSVPVSSQSHSAPKSETDKKTDHSSSEHSSQKQGTSGTTAKLTTTAPTICVRAVSKSGSSQPKPYIPYTTKVSSQEMQMTNLYQQQLQYQLAIMQQQSSPIRTSLSLYKTGSSKDPAPKLSSPMMEMGGMFPQQQTQQQPPPQKDKADKILSEQHRHISEKQRQEQRQLSEQQRQITDQQRQIILQQSGYRLSTGGHVVVGKFPGSGFDHMAQAHQYQLALAAATPPSKSRTSSVSESGSRKSTKQSPYALPSGKPFGSYMQAQLTKPHQTVPETRPRKGGTPEDVFKFPDDDEERNSLRRAEERQKQVSGDRRDKEVDRPLSYQQKQQLHSKMLHERQLMEARAIHERKVEDDIKRFKEEFCKNIDKIAGELSMPTASQESREHPVVSHASSSHALSTMMTSSQRDVTSSHKEHVSASERRGVEVQHYLSEGRGYPAHGLTITTPHLTLPASSGHLVTSSGIIITHPHSSTFVEDYNKRNKRKMVGQDYINSLLKSALSLLQKTLKIRPKTRLVNPSYPPHIWHQQSMDPKFVEKGLTPIDLMTVKKKLEFGEYPSFEAFYNDVTHFQRNYSEVYPAEHQLRQEIDEIMGVFLKELNEIYRGISSHQALPSGPSSKKIKPDGS